MKDLTILVFILLAFLFSACQNEEELPLRFVTYNIRYDNPTDTIHGWALRKNVVVDLLHSQSPDVFGVQEALENQADDLEAMLSIYARYGVGRDDGKNMGEQTTIFYKKEKFNLLDKGTFWLSKNPNVPGSIGWDAMITRICSWVKLQEKATGKTCFVFNAHFDHRGEVARLESMKLIREKIIELAGNSPFVLLGDFNFEPEEAPYEIAETWGIQDAFLDAEKEVDSEPCTFTGFQVEGAECRRIDYIFASEHFLIKTCSIHTDHDGTYFPSDHLPVVAEVLLR